MSSNFYTTKIQLFTSYFDCNHNIKPTAIFNIFQDLACVHGELIGVGFKEMLQKNLYWVLTRVKYDILTNPNVDQVVVLETWPCEKGRVDFDRDFLIKNEQGEILIKGTSKWCVINATTRMLERPTLVNYTCECRNEKVYADKFVKTEVCNQFEPANYEHIVSFSEIDHNQHLNNVNYATYVTNTLKNITFNHLQINFISECKLNDKISVCYIKNQNNEYVISGYVNNTLKFTALAK